MSKYLIVTKECDYISSSKNAKEHTQRTKGTGVMIYDKDGILINSTTKNIEGKIITHGSKFFDGEPRKWAIDFIKNNVVGTIINDASCCM
jgi:hypothetical protein